jgi:hypothetical protein
LEVNSSPYGKRQYNAQNVGFGVGL